jgi:hypothetical protein
MSRYLKRDRKLVAHMRSLERRFELSCYGYGSILFPTHRLRELRAAAEFGAIYFLWEEREHTGWTVSYVGGTKKLGDRLREHDDQGRPFEAASFIPCRHCRLLANEKLWIALTRPWRQSLNAYVAALEYVTGPAFPNDMARGVFTTLEIAPRRPQHIYTLEVVIEVEAARSGDRVDVLELVSWNASDDSDFVSFPP